jgi:DNA-binding XRE family transcriptional regulator
MSMWLTCYPSSPILEGMKTNEALLYQKLGQQLRQKREIANLTQAQLAEGVGLLRTSITNIEAGRQKAPLHLIYELCAIFQVEIKDILPLMSELAETKNSTIEIGGRLKNVPPRSAELIDELLHKAV